MNDSSSLTGPIYAVYQDNDLSLFRELEACNFHGLDCLKGVPIKAGKLTLDWRAGLPFYIPYRSITRIVEYPSLDEFHRLVREHHVSKSPA